MTPHDGEFVIESENDIVAARKIVRDAAEALGFGLTDVTRIVTAASELTRNIYVHAKSGVMRWRSVGQGSVVGLRAYVRRQRARNLRSREGDGTGIQHGKRVGHGPARCQEVDR